MMKTMPMDPAHTRDADVRMRGFSRRTTVEAALAWVDAATRVLGSESMSLWSAAGRVLAEDVISTVNVPGFARSMMDGYALHAANTQGATAYNRLTLKVVGQSLPGRAFPWPVARGETVRIMTGAPIPAGADAVLPAEKIEADRENIFALEEVPPGKNIGRTGEDVAAGARVLSAGRILRPQDVGVLSSIGCSHVSVVRRPRVRLVVTGNELLPAGSSPADNRIADANGPMLAALVARDGGAVAHSGDIGHLVSDDPAAILAAMQEEADIVLVSGGSSVGQEDHAPLLLAQHGELAIHGVAMRPSSPAGMGRLGRALVFLLPGNPVSCLCAYDFFAGRAIRQLGGRSAAWPYPQRRLPLGRKLVSQVGRVDYARVKIVDGRVEPVAISGASILTSTTEADGFVIVQADSEGVAAGAEVAVFLYDGHPQ